MHRSKSLITSSAQNITVRAERASLIGEVEQPLLR